MKPFVSTMDAPLTNEETESILNSWHDLTQGAIPPTNPEPTEMLTYCNNLMMLIYELRRAVDRGWCAANKRKWPAPRPQRERAKSNQTAEELLAELRSFGATDAAILELLNKTGR